MTDRRDSHSPADASPEPTVASGIPAPPAEAGGGTIAWSPAGEPPPPAGMHLAAGELLANRFRIVRFIGHGGMGDVYEAEDLELGERVALKTVRSEVAHLDGAVERFRREIHLARKVTHPNVCRIFDVFRHRPEEAAGSAARGAEITFFSMELLAGETLEQRLRDSARMRPEEALPIVRQVAEGLSAAHRAGVIHRDFKPANVMLVPTGGELRAVVTDFGLARTHGEGENLTLRGDILGTPSYMAPEQVAGGEVTAATDIYALGCVIYEMVTGVPPFVGANSFSTALKRLQEDPRPPHLRAPDLQPAWDAAILRCLERAPADRFAQARDVAAALGGEVFAPGPRRRRRLRRRALAAAAALVLLAALALAGARWLRRPAGRAVSASSGRTLAAFFRSPEELYAGGVKLLEKLDAPGAQEAFERAVAARKDYWLAHSGLAVALAQLGHDDRAAKEAKLAFDHAAGLPREEGLLVAARYWQVARRSDKAAESYQQLQSSFPDNVEYGLGLVRALSGSGRGSAALQVVNQLKQRPSTAVAGPRLDLAEAEVEMSLSDFPRLAQAARRAQEQAERDGADLVAARALYLEGGAFTKQGDLKAALDAYKKAEAIYAGTADQRSLAQILSATAIVLYYQGDLELARGKAQEALDSFKDVGDLSGESNALSLLAAIEGEQGNLASAQSRFATLIENYRHLGDRQREARATGNLGFALKKQGKSEEAAKRFDQALALYRQLQDRAGQAEQLFLLARASFDQLNLQQAEAHASESLSLATAIDAPSAIVDALELQADVAFARGDLATARAKDEEALTRCRGIGDKSRIAENQVALAELELEKGHPSPALAYAREALEQFQSEHNGDQEARTGALLARAFLAHRSLAEAQAAVEKAGPLAAKSLVPEVKITVALARARLAAAKPAAALGILKQALAQAQAAGLGELALEVRLAAGEIESAGGDRQRASQDLAVLEREARSHGFGLIADRAARARTATGR